MTDPEWTKVIGFVAAAWEDLPGDQVLEVWRTWLEPYPAEVVIHAVQKLAEEGLYSRPKIGQIIRECKIATLGKRPTFGELFEEMRDKAAAARWTSEPEDLHWSHPLFPMIVRQIGWHEFMNSDPENRAPFVARMRRIFDDALERGDAEEAVEAERVPELEYDDNALRRLLENMEDNRLPSEVNVSQMLTDMDKIGRIDP